MYGVSSDTLAWLASGLSGHCVKKQCGLVGMCFGERTALDLHLSRVRTGVAAMRQNCNCQLDNVKLGRKRGKKNIFDSDLSLTIKSDDSFNNDFDECPV